MEIGFTAEGAESAEGEKVEKMGLVMEGFGVRLTEPFWIPAFAGMTVRIWRSMNRVV